MFFEEDEDNPFIYKYPRSLVLFGWNDWLALLWQMRRFVFVMSIAGGYVWRKFGFCWFVFHMIALVNGYEAVAYAFWTILYIRGTGKLNFHSGWTRVANFEDVWSLSEYVYSKGRIRIEDMALEMKSEMNKLSKEAFNRMKFHMTGEEKKAAGVPSRGYYKMKDLLGLVPVSEGAMVVDICAGRGGFTQCILDEAKAREIVAFSMWDEQGQEEWCLPDNPKVRLIKGKYQETEPIKVDHILFDGGEQSQKPDKEAARNLELLKGLTPWMIKNPGAKYTIKILCPWYDEVRELLELWQRITGRGDLVRLKRERLSTSAMYFVSLPKVDLKQRIEGFLVKLKEKREDAVTSKSTWMVKIGDLVHRQWVWPKLGDLGVKKLQPLDMEESLKEYPALQKPRMTTQFLREIGWFKIPKSGSEGTRRNEIVMTVVGRLPVKLKGFTQWMMTSTTPLYAWKLVQKKIDNAPKESHTEWKSLRVGFNALAKWMRKKGMTYTMCTDDELGGSINRLGSMGVQEQKLGYKNLGEYFDSGSWKEREEMFKESLKKGRPKLGVFNTMVKKEKKRSVSGKKTAGRLVWFLPATARLFEGRVFSNLNQLVKRLPFTVSGVPLYDYGEMLARKIREGYLLCTDDIGGWDTRVGAGMMSLECDFLKQLTDDDDHKTWIERLYRLYAYPVLAVDREVGGESEKVLCQSQGQRASGVNITYSMNTITNIVICLVRMAKSIGVPEDALPEWIEARLESGGDEEFDGLISGDDSVIMGKEENMEKFGSDGICFLNEIGFIRKDIDKETPSPLYVDLESVSFCSHSFVKIKYRGRFGTADRWMPVRGEDEIFAKASMMGSEPKDKTTEEAWARAQGINMLVNYHHLPDVKMAALAILSATDPNIMLEGLQLPGRWMPEPWMINEDVMAILQKCLFGSSTNFPNQSFQLLRIRDLGMVKGEDRRRYGVDPHLVDRQRWASDLPGEVGRVRKRHPTVHYQNWLGEMARYDREGIFGERG